MCYLAVHSMAVTHILHKSYGIRTSLRKTNTSIIHQEIEQFFLFIIIKIAFLPTLCARQQMTRYSILQGALGDTILFNNVTSTQGAWLVCSSVHALYDKGQTVGAAGTGTVCLCLLLYFTLWARDGNSIGPGQSTEKSSSGSLPIHLIV